LPPAQCKHTTTEVACTSNEYLPAGQRVQVVDAAEMEYVPARHDTQKLELLAAEVIE